MCSWTWTWTRLRREGSEGSEGSKGSEGKVLRIDRPDGRRVLKFDGLSGRGLWIALRAMSMKSALRDLVSVPYSKITILLTGSLRSPPPIRAAPDFPLFRGKNKTLRNTLFISGSIVSTGYSAPSKRGKGGGASHQRGNAFPRPQGGFEGFIQTGAFYNLKAPSTTLSGKAAVKLKNPRGHSPVRL